MPCASTTCGPVAMRVWPGVTMVTVIPAACALFPAFAASRASMASSDAVITTAMRRTLIGSPPAAELIQRGTAGQMMPRHEGTGQDPAAATLPRFPAGTSWPALCQSQPDPNLVKALDER